MKKIIITTIMSLSLLGMNGSMLLAQSTSSPKPFDTSGTAPVPLPQAPNDNNGNGIPNGLPSGQSGTNRGCTSSACVRDILTLLQYIMFLIQNYLVSLMFALAIIFFLWNVLAFIYNPGDANGRTETLKNIGLSLVALFVMFAIYGIIAFISNSTGIGIGGSIEIPRFKLEEKK